MRVRRQNFRSYDLAKKLFGPSSDWRRTEWAHRCQSLWVYLGYVGLLGIMISIAINSAIQPTFRSDLPIRIIWVLIAAYLAWAKNGPVPRKSIFWLVWLLWTGVISIFILNFFKPSPDFLSTIRMFATFIGPVMLSWTAIVLVWLCMAWRAGPEDQAVFERLRLDELPGFITRLKNEDADVLGIEVIPLTKLAGTNKIFGFVCEQWSPARAVIDQIEAWAAELRSDLGPADFELEVLWRESVRKAPDEIGGVRAIT